MNKILFYIIMVVLLLVYLTGCGTKEDVQAETGQPDYSDTEIHSKSVVKPHFELDFTLKDHNGREVKLSDYAGKIVVLEWLNYDCPFVKYHYEAGTMKKLAEEYMNKNVVWLAINSTKYANIGGNKNFVEKYDLHYPVLDDHTGKIGKLFGAATTPHIFIVNAKGGIAYNGAIDNAPNGKLEGDLQLYAKQALSEITEGKSVSIPKTKPYGCSVKYAD